MAQDYKGSMFIRTMSNGNEIIYYRPYKGKKRSSGLLNTARNRKIVEEKLKQKYLEYLQKSKGMPIKNSSNELRIIDVFDEFLKSKQRAKMTKKSYKESFNKIVSSNYNIDKVETTYLRGNYVVKYRIELDCKDFMDDNNKEYSHLSSTSKNIALRSFQSFVTYCAVEGYIPDLKVYRKYKKRDIKKKEVEPYTQEELDKQLNFLKDTNRDLYLYIRFLSLCGSRGKEALELNIKKDIDLENRTITFRNKINKNSKDVIPITSKLLPIIKELIKRAEKRSKRKEMLFKWKETSTSSIARDLKKVQEKLNIRKKGRALHGFRKYFINSLFDARFQDGELSIYEIKSLARHSNINVTMEHYQKFKNHDLINKVDKIF